MVIVAWHKVCKPEEEGGLGITSLTTLNEAANLKLCWEMHISREPWAFLLKIRALNQNKPVLYHFFSSIYKNISIQLYQIICMKH